MLLYLPESQFSHLHNGNDQALMSAVDEMMQGKHLAEYLAISECTKIISNYSKALPKAHSLELPEKVKELNWQEERQSQVIQQFLEQGCPAAPRPCKCFGKWHMMSTGTWNHGWAGK